MAATTTQAPPAVFAALLAVQGGLDAIAKERRVQEGPARFQFRGVDDVMNALHPLLVQHGVIVLPQVQERTTETRATRNGSAMNVVHLRVRFTFTAQDGSTTYAEAWGEGQDSGDKATGKAHSMAYKSAMLQTFSVPTENTLDDADRDTTEAAPQPPRARQGRPAVSTAPAEPPAHLQPFWAAFGALTEDQRQWVRDNWPSPATPPDAMTVSQAAQAVEWMAANVPPPVAA